MKSLPENTKILTIDSVLELVTNADKFDLKESYAYDMRGFRIVPGKIGERDFGTIHRYPTYPTYKDAAAATQSLSLVNGFNLYIPSEDTEYDIFAGYDNATAQRLRLYVQYAPKAITGATNATPISVTIANHGFSTNDVIVISGVGGNTAANGVWTITVTGANAFTLNGSVGSGAYTTGGLAVKSVELTRVVRCKVNGTPGATAVSVTIDTVTDYLDQLTALTPATDEFKYYIAVNQTGARAGTTAFIKSNTATVLTGVSYFGSSCLGWLDNDDVWLYRMTGIYDGYVFEEGTDPHIRWMDVEAQNKVNMLYGSSASPPVMQEHIHIRKAFHTTNGNAAGGGDSFYFRYYDPNIGIPVHHILTSDGYLSHQPYIGLERAILIGTLATYYSLSATAGWYVDKAQLTPYFQRSGTGSAPRLTTETGFPQPIQIGEGMQVTINGLGNDSDGSKKHVRFYVTALYRGVDATFWYQESDPIFQLNVSPVGNYFPRFTASIDVDLSRIHKTVAGFRVYMQMARDVDIASNLANFLDDPREYIQVKEFLLIDPLWLEDPAQRYAYRYRISLGKAEYEDAVTSAASNLFANLAHDVDTNRSRIRARYATKASREQGAILVFDENDRTLRFTSYDGGNVHEDDNLPDVTVDANNNKQQVGLSAAGDLMGLAILDDQILSFRSTEVEFHDLQSGVQESHYCDFYSKKSLLSIGQLHNPSGLLWTGKSGIYFLAKGGGQIKLLSQKINNKIDGTLYTTDGITPYISDAYRRAMVTGYDPTYHEAYVFTQQNKDGGGSEYVCYIVSFENELRWRTREFNLTGSVIKFFSSKRDGSMTIGTAAALIKYPYRVPGGTAHVHEDEVTYLEASSSKGIPTKIRIVCGSLYQLTNQFILSHVDLDFIATSANNNVFNMALFFNGVATALDTKVIVSAARPLPRAVKRAGMLKKLELEISIPATNLEQFKVLELNKLELVLVGPQQRIGDI